MSKHESHNLIKGLGAAALITAAAAGYYLTGPGGKKHQAKAKAWAMAAKKDLAAKLAEMQEVSQTAYKKASAEVLLKYRQMKNVKPEELAAFGEELKQHWENIQKKAMTLGTPKKNPVKKTSAKNKKK
ncbi:MAG: hypothetical protein P4L74_06975 [Candidatus Doudnabacteria bacterium]|nr:hypothetical protein [Candidatus Doudnabacteria bacterium]